MDIKIDKIGIILDGEERGWYVRVVDDFSNTGGYLIFTFNSLDPDSKGYQCFDSWVESPNDLQDYFKESAWKVRWFSNH